MKELLDLTQRPRIVTICTGAGAMLTRILAETPRASQYLVGSYFPYDPHETASMLGFMPGRFVCEETAIHLATEAYMRASLRCGPGDAPVGLGLTASIASATPHRGDHRYAVALFTDHGVRSGETTLEKASGIEARRADDDTCSRFAASILAFDHSDKEPPQSERARDVFLSRPFFTTGPGETRRKEPHGGIFFPGNFDPMHFGHEGIAEKVAAWAREPVIPWITANPPHKPALTVSQMAKRAAHIRSRGFPVLFSDGDPLYIDKARCFPGRSFIIGADALVRMLDPKWGPEVKPMLHEFVELGTRFFVVPRMVDGKLVTVNDVGLGGFRSICKGVEGQWDVSSTELRAGAEEASCPPEAP